MTSKKVNILGTEYVAKLMNEVECPKFVTNKANGLAEIYSKEILINVHILENKDERAFDNIHEFLKKVTRHEVIHAFFHEAGLMKYCDDEELTDCLAILVPKMLNVFKELNCE